VDRLARVVPSSRVLLERAARRGESLGRVSAALLDLLGEYGPEALEAAMTEVLTGDATHVHAVRQVLERNHASRGKAPAQALPIPTDPRYRDLTVQPQALSGYDDLAKREAEKGDASHEATGHAKEGESDERQATDSDAR
jgi:hypothetical protein